MKKFFTKSVSVFLTIALLAVTVIPVFLASANGGLPNVYVFGRSSVIYDDPASEQREQIYPHLNSEAEILEAAAVVLPIFGISLATNQWDSYCDALYNQVTPFYERYVLNESGEVKDNSGIAWSWSVDTLIDTKNNGQYGLNDYPFPYDFRLDPCVNAEILNSYINDILTVTGAGKVNLLGRCMGNDIVMAYLAKYGSSKISTCVLLNSTVNGVELCSELFAGKIKLTPDGVDRFASDVLGDDYLTQLLKATISVANVTSGIGQATDLVNGVYAKIGDMIANRLLIGTYATFPSYWAMVDDENYEAAKAFVFGNETEKYAGLIEKIDYYHYNVQVKAYDILREAKANGVNVNIISKYGYQITPVIESVDLQSDSTASLAAQSFGATCSPVSSTLGSEYIADAEQNGTAKYISPDKQVDASTCLFPDNTWFIKGLTHNDFPASLDGFLIAVLNYNGQMTVNDNAAYPQYMTYNSKTGEIVPLEGTKASNPPKYSNDFFTVMIRFLKSLLVYLISLFKK